MIRKTRIGSISFTEFLDQVREDQKADLIDGVIFMPSPENMDHNDLLAWLTTIIRPYVEARRLGRMTMDRVAFRLSANSAPEPDLAVVRTERLALLKRGFVDGAPDLAVEIVSPDSAERDYSDKFRLYEKAGVREYWIIDPEESRATFFAAEEGVGFVELSLEGSRFRSRVLPGFELDVDWLWQRPLPPTLPIVQAMLARA